MKTVMRITQKGQVTIPQEFRMHFGLLPNTEVIFEEKNNTLEIKKANTNLSRGKSITDRLKDSGTSGLSTDEIMAFTRQ